MQPNAHSLLLLSMLGLVGCNSAPLPQLPSLMDIDLHKFSGTWYVLSSIPTLFEKDAYNATEHYALTDKNRVSTTFTFNKNSPNGDLRSFTSTGFVSKESNALWGMQFIWPFKAEYRILHIDKGYEHVVIGRSARDYLWIMAREPIIPEEKLVALEKLAIRLGYDKEKIVRIPQTSRE